MADKKSTSRAERAVSGVKKNGPASGSAAKPVSKRKNTSAKKSAEKNPPKVKTEYENPVSNNFVNALISLLLFILFLIMGINPEGVLLQVVKSVILGLIGPAAFYFSIPALLYLFFIHTFGRKSAVRMRSICVILFVFLCGSVYHLIVGSALNGKFVDAVVSLYQSGMNGNSGGLLCGGAAHLLRWGCGVPLSYLITILGATLALLGAMQITIPSIIRAIANRPRATWDDEDDDYIEPAAIVVNHIANKKIEQKRQKRERIQQEKQPVPMQEQVESVPPVVKKAAPKTPVQEAIEKKEPEPQAQDTVKQVPGKGAAFMNRIDMDINAPLSGTADFVREDIPSVFEESVEIPDVPAAVPVAEVNKPRKMPNLELDRPSQPAKKKAEKENTKVTNKEATESARQVAEEIAKIQV